MKIDLHTHTQHSSDSSSKIKDVVKRCRDLGIIPAITDHDNMDAHKHFRELGFKFIPGEEIKTKEGDLIGLYLTETIRKDTPFLEAVDLIKEQGGLAYLPHMYDALRKGVSKAELAKKVDIVEVYNPRCFLDSHNENARKFAIENRKLLGAGSDGHFVFEIGNAYVEAPDIDVGEPKGLVEALKKGRVFGKRPWMGPQAIRVMTTSRKMVRKIFRV